MAYGRHTSIVIPADRLAARAGFAVTPQETSRLAEALAESTLPDARVVSATPFSNIN